MAKTAEAMEAGHVGSAVIPQEDQLRQVKVVDLTLRRTPLLEYRGVLDVRIIQTPMFPLGRQIVLETGETATFNAFKTRFIWDNQG